MAKLKKVKVPKPKKIKIQKRFGIGEWYGKPFVDLTGDERQQLATDASLTGDERQLYPCPFRRGGKSVCNKNGGVCSLQQYKREGEDGETVVDSSDTGDLRITCPVRFEQDSMIYRWIGETILNCSNPHILEEISFLERMPTMGNPKKEGRDVGKIDNVLVVPNSSPLEWCPVEVQAVYFSGPGMDIEFTHMSKGDVDKLPFPKKLRRPDYRSSGPKRLMPQLLIKIPELRRWGKKMAVVVGSDFFRSLGRMDEVQDISNCDVAWFVVKTERDGDIFKLKPDKVCLTTLESSVLGLVAGKAVSRKVFEDKLIARISGLT